jgi:lipoprotein-anchoring transpeptidase ErfK/SrfK
MTNRFNTADRSAAVRPWRAATIVALASAAALIALAAAPSAHAATTRRPHPARPTEAMAPRPAGEPIMAIVSIKSQQVTIYDANGWILRAPVSSGIKGRETPAGVFAVVEKNKDHHSSLYDDAWMPNMLRITWNGIALHGGPLPGYAASHGCVRMPYGFAEKLFDKVPMGMRVIIAPDDAEPVAFSDPALFEPKQDVIDALPARVEPLARAADEATKAAAAAKIAIAPAKREAAMAQAALRKLTYFKRGADGALAYAERVAAAARTDAAKARAEEMQQKASAKAAAVGAQFDAATAEAKTKQDALAAAEANAKTTEAKRIEAAAAANDAELALEPAAIFVSRATQKLYVRRDTHKRIPDGGERYDTSLEFPVAIAHPDKPLGTHIFTAVARAEGGLRWTEVTIDSGDNAKDALDRITFPKEVLDRIAPTAVPGSSITISDEPLSTETNYRTEFVVVLSNQPQGGFLNRAPSTETYVARGNEDNNNFFGSSWFGSNSGWGSSQQTTRQPQAAPRPRSGQNYYPQQPHSWW